jgi:hypothetical protein
MTKRFITLGLLFIFMEIIDAAGVMASLDRESLAIPNK